MHHVSAFRLSLLFGALVGASLLWVGLKARPSSSSRAPNVVVLSCAGDRASVRGERVVVEYENGIGNVLLEPRGRWPSTITIHFVPPFHRRFEAFNVTASSRGVLHQRPNTGRAVPHRLLRASDSHGVSYELDTSRVTDDVVGIGWIDTFRM